MFMCVRTDGLQRSRCEDLLVGDTHHKSKKALTNEQIEETENESNKQTHGEEETGWKTDKCTHKEGEGKKVRTE